MFASLLVANRGEIACRIFRTARAMGVKCIAVYSEADARAKHVREADEAHLIGPAPAADSYLNSARVLAAAKKSGAAALHPGYGFLSENPAFAEAVIAAGIVWVGPQPSAIRAMGLKDEAKRIAEQAGAPVVPGYHGADQSEAALLSAAKEIGFPVLIKAIAGGGGRGIREVREAGEFSAALASARREAKAAFGDERVLVEKLITRPRHIEVQVFGDSHGHLVHLFERDCSLQRRRQKVIEQAPAPGMTDEARAAMTSAALNIARAVNYQNAGTVEFIVEGAPRVDNFYFMEMNTRLQVEHPVTEFAVGAPGIERDQPLDLVAWQLRVAAGERLPAAQDELFLRADAIQARVCAEDPSADFRPSAGRMQLLSADVLKHGRATIRVDAGYASGDSIGGEYDNLLLKVIAQSRNGALARQFLAVCLESLQAVGVKTNAGFLARCLRHDAVMSGDYDTSFIEQNLAALADNRGARRLALDEYARRLMRADASPWGARDGWRVNAAAAPTIRVDVDGVREAIRWPVAEEDGAVIDVLELGDVTHVMVLGESFAMRWPGAHSDLDEAAASDAILAPLPGRIAAVNVTPGAAVKRGAVLAVLEAMKMEHALTAPRDGLVAEVAVRPGAQVKQRDLIVRLAPL